MLNGIDRGLHFAAELKIRCLKECDRIAHIGGASAKVQEDVFQVKGWIKACPLEVDRTVLYRSIAAIVTARGLEGNFWEVGGLGLSNRRGGGKGIEPSRAGIGVVSEREFDQLGEIVFLGGLKGGRMFPQGVGCRDGFGFNLAIRLCLK